jgi:hypothetical protein
VHLGSAGAFSAERNADDYIAAALRSASAAIVPVPCGEESLCRRFFFRKSRKFLDARDMAAAPEIAPHSFNSRCKTREFAFP